MPQRDPAFRSIARRVQLKRVKGWRMPLNTLKVDRTTRWGNHAAARVGASGAEAVQIFIAWVEQEATEEWKQAASESLRDKQLACWCKIGEPCHADYLMDWIQLRGFGLRIDRNLHRIV
jgi:Domain of unknown function (DUF4326)